MKTRIRCCDVALAIIGILCVILGILGLALFPSLYESIVFSQLQLTGDLETNSLGISTRLLATPPMNNQMMFYFFNVTNQDEMMYEGAPPRVIQIGPYNFLETEEKRYLQFNEDNTQLYYQNYKKWVYSQDISCEDCNYHDFVTIPNAPQVGCAAGLGNPKYHVTPVAKFIISLGLIVLGEQPFNTPRVGDLLFDGYQDALLSGAHSHLIDVLDTVFNRGKSIIPIPVPAMHTMAYFNGYNNSRDEEYWVNTGKDDVYNFGKVESWAGTKVLPEDWWTTEQARMINGSDTGSLGPPHLTQDSVLPMFHSYLCRSFNSRYEGKTEIHGIPSYRFSVKEDEWDTTLEKNKGFRYPNYEKVKYYDWPKCPYYNSSNCRARPDEPIDCSRAENLCDDCCYQGYTGGTWVMPPGMFPLACYPGRLQPSPFGVIWSPPHFLYSPKEVSSSIKGINPDPKEHQPMIYDHEPYSGMITHVNYRVQISVPVFDVSEVIQNSHLPSSMVPVFWEGSETYLADFAYSFYTLGFVFAPKFSLGISIALIVLGAIFLLALAIRVYRNRK